MLTYPSWRYLLVPASHCLPFLKGGGPALALNSNIEAACGPLAHFPAVLLEAISLEGRWEQQGKERPPRAGLDQVGVECNRASGTWTISA